MILYESIWHFVWIHYMISGILYLFTIMSHYIVVAVINISGDKKHILLTIAWMLLIHTLNNFLWHIDALLLPFDVIFYAFYTLKAPIERKDKTKVCTYETFLAMTLSTGSIEINVKWYSKNFCAGTILMLLIYICWMKNLIVSEKLVLWRYTANIVWRGLSSRWIYVV